MFAVAVGLIWSTDQLLLFLAAGERPTANRDSEPEPLKIAPPGAIVPWMVAVPYLALIVFHLNVYGMGEGPPTPSGAVAGSLDALDVETLPAQVGPWQRRQFAVQTRNPGSAFGEVSKTWTYQGAGCSAQFSLDFPFPYWHDLTRCYTSQGWTREDQAVHPAGCAEAAGPAGVVAVQLRKPAYRSGYLLFSECDGRGDWLAPRKGGAFLSLYRHESVLRQWGLTSGPKGEAAPTDPKPPVYQVQLFVESYAPLSGEQQAQARALFRTALGPWRSVGARELKGWDHATFPGRHDASDLSV